MRADARHPILICWSITTRPIKEMPFMKAYMIIVLFISFWGAPVALADKCIEGDCVNGYGTLVTSTGQKFTGHFKDGMRHGRGVFILPGGRKLEGTWKDNEIVEAVVTFIDTSDRRATEEDREKLNAQLQQAQKLEAVGTLASGIAHDFNNILSAILGYTELAKLKLPPDSEVSKDLAEVFQGVNRAKDLVKHTPREGGWELPPMP